MSSNLNDLIRAEARQINHVGELRIKCPECSETRKKKHERTLSCRVDGDSIVYYCHHCNLSGVINDESPGPVQTTNFFKPSRVVPIAEVGPTQSLTSEWIDWLALRSLSKATAEQFGLVCGERHCGGKTSEAIGFPYRSDGHITAIKWRTSDKRWTQEGAARTFWGMEAVNPEHEFLCVAEGELDAMALRESGVSAISVPNGAPTQVSEKALSPEQDKRFAYVWAAQEFLEGWSKIIICGDTDAPGKALSEELARRIGRAKCWRAVWPDGGKDANQTLMEHGIGTLRECVENAEPFPLAGLFGADHYVDQVSSLYNKGVIKGKSTGFASLDPYYTVADSALTVVTGLPSAGKSQFCDAVTVHLARQHDWKFAMCSFENPTDLHCAKLAEQYIGLPFFESPERDRMSQAQMEEAMAWVADHYVFIDQEDGSGATIDDILERFQSSVSRLGIRGACIDPFNYIEMRGEASETHLISDMLTKVQNFARANSVHVWFVAHPTKMQRDGGRIPVPEGNDISGSFAWFAKADIGMTVGRGMMPNTADITIWKCRHKWHGSHGSTTLQFDPDTGRYFDEDDSDFDWDF